MTIKGIQPWRKLVEVLEGIVILGLPFLKVKGESALRFDVPSLRLHFFGIGILMDEFFIVLLALFFVIFLIILVTLIFGRIWCGWVCPQTVLIDYTGFMDKAKMRGLLYKTASYAAVFIISAVVSANLIWYFVSPYMFFEKLFKLELGRVIWWFWIALAGIIFLNFAFLRHKWCSTVCPYAKLQSVMFDSKTMVIAFDPMRKEECTNCMTCVRTCPVGIDIREGLHPACINCAECLDKCTTMMSPKGRKGLIGYFWGLPGEAAKGILRTNALLIGSLMLVSFFPLVYMSLTRTSVDLTILPNYNFPPRMTNGKAVINSYLLSIRNRGSGDEELRITVRGLKDITVAPDRVVIKAGEKRTLPVYVTSTDTGIEDGMKSIEVAVESGTAGAKSAKKANFIITGVK